MKAGITGAGGILGRTLVDINRSERPIEWVRFPGDIRRRADIDEWLGANPDLDALIHLAAVVPVREVEENLPNAVDVNVGGTCRLMEAVARRYESRAAPWVFLASTSHVYRSADMPLSEDSATCPISAYGLTKLQSEEWASWLADRYSIPLCVGRIFSSWSPLQKVPSFLPSGIQRIRSAPSDARIEMPGLHGTRDFLSAMDIAGVIRDLMEKRPEGTLNIASGIAVSLLEAASSVRDTLGRSDVEIVALNRDTCHLQADIRRLRAILPRAELSFSLHDFPVEFLAARSGTDEPEGRK
jgi:nucleoside-diphosphate-sugar epimerase